MATKPCLLATTITAGVKMTHVTAAVRNPATDSIHEAIGIIKLWCRGRFEKARSPRDKRSSQKYSTKDVDADRDSAPLPRRNDGVVPENAAQGQVGLENL